MAAPQIPQKRDFQGRQGGYKPAKSPQTASGNVISLFPPTVSDLVQQDLLKDYISTSPDVKFKFNANLVKLLVQKNRLLRSEHFIDFIQRCQITGADPRKNQAYLVTFNKTTKVGEEFIQEVHGVTIFSYHFMINKAQDTKGLIGWKIETKAEDYFDMETQKSTKQLCSYAIIERKGRKPIVYRAWFSEFAKKVEGKLTEMWRTKPYMMLEKCALVNGIRQAFPDMFAGMYISEEILGTESMQVSDEPLENFGFDDSDFTIDKIADASRIGGTPVVDKSAHATMKPTTVQDPGEYVINFGKYRGQKLSELDRDDLTSYVTYLSKKSAQTDMGPNVAQFIGVWKKWQLNKASGGPEKLFDVNEKIPEDRLPATKAITQAVGGPVTSDTRIELWSAIQKSVRFNRNIKLPVAAKRIKSVTESEARKMIDMLNRKDFSCIV